MTAARLRNDRSQGCGLPGSGEARFRQAGVSGGGLGCPCGTAALPPAVDGLTDCALGQPPFECPSGILTSYSPGTPGVLQGYSRGTRGVLQGYSRGAVGVLPGTQLVLTMPRDLHGGHVVVQRLLVAREPRRVGRAPACRGEYSAAVSTLQR